MTDPDMQGGAEWRGDVEDGREVHQTPVKQPSNNPDARISEFGDNCLTCGLYAASCESQPDALREAFEAVRWRVGDNSDPWRVVCSACWYPKTTPEVHAPGCIVGKVGREK